MMNTFDIYRRFAVAQRHVLAKMERNTSSSVTAYVAFSAFSPFNLLIDWGDGVSEIIHVPITDTIFRHEYTMPFRTHNFTIYLNDCSKLKSFRAGRDIYTADITPCSNLTRIEFISDELRSLDIGIHAALTSLNCYGNYLFTLDISNCPLLSDLDCGQNRLPSSEINSILANLVAHGLDNGVLRCCQYNAASPTGQGLIDKQTLIDRGWTVTTD